ncbi:hypothetical protein KJ885_04150 [Patescibacteria group bacterium]|nr:hypothetical protein [Patescibacteria group bacterium]
MAFEKPPQPEQEPKIEASVEQEASIEEELSEDDIQGAEYFDSLEAELKERIAELKELEGPPDERTIKLLEEQLVEWGELE